MDFEETEEEKRFRAEARAWLETRAQRREPGSNPEHFYSSNDSSEGSSRSRSPRPGVSASPLSAQVPA